MEFKISIQELVDRLKSGEIKLDHDGHYRDNTKRMLKSHAEQIIRWYERIIERRGNEPAYVRIGDSIDGTSAQCQVCDEVFWYVLTDEHTLKLVRVTRDGYHSMPCKPTDIYYRFMAKVAKSPEDFPEDIAEAAERLNTRKEN